MRAILSITCGILVPLVFCQDNGYDLDFLQSFFIKNEKLITSQRLQNLGAKWMKGTSYERAVGITIENWTNHKLEFPELTLSDGAVDRWLKPQVVRRHQRDIALLAYGVRGGDTKGSVSYLVEDSWPRTWVSIGWFSTRNGVDVILAWGKTHLEYDDLLKHESNAQAIQDGVRFFKASDKFVLSVSCKVTDSNYQLTVSVLPQNMDFWAWEKYYRSDEKIAQSSTVQKIDILTTKRPVTGAYNGRVNPDLENEAGIFERKELLFPGQSVRMLGNMTERVLLSKETASVAAAIRLENWSKYPIQSPNLIKLNYGSQSEVLPLVGVDPGQVELAVLKQSGRFTGVSGILQWPIKEKNTIISLMISVPYNPQTWGTWVAMGIFKLETEEDKLSVPDFDAMYYGTPDSAWFVRENTGGRLEFSNKEFVLILDSDTSLSKPILHLALLPANPVDGADSIKLKLEGKSPPEERRRKASEGDLSIVSALSSGTSAQCHCPCLGSSGAFSCTKVVFIFALCLQMILTVF